MVSQAAIRRSKWRVSRVPYRGGEISCVYRHKRGKEWEPWTVVAPSALLRRLGIDSLGLYAARPFEDEDYVGVYPMNDVVGRYASREEAVTSKEAIERDIRGRDKMITVRSKGEVLLLDGERGEGAQVQRANDPRGTRLRPNTYITDAGYMRVTSAVPAFRFDKSVEQNVRSELRYSYGDDFWAT